MRNTKKRGIYELFVYPEKKGHYVGVCLTLNIVEEGPDPEDLIDSLAEAARGHVLAVIKEGLNDDLLNRPAPQEYWDKYRKFQDYVSSRKKTPEHPPSFDLEASFAQQRGFKDLIYA